MDNSKNKFINLFFFKMDRDSYRYGFALDILFYFGWIRSIQAYRDQQEEKKVNETFGNNLPYSHASTDTNEREASIFLSSISTKEEE
jgi:hypothetical protein